IHPDDRHLVIKHFQHLILSQKPGTCEFRFQCANGKWIVLESKGVPIMTKQGECDGFIVVSRDITERRHNEELLHKAEKLSMIGELAAGIAHEIRNPLTSLKGFIQLLAPTLQDNKLYADIMLSELERINFIVSELLVLSKPQNLQIKSISLVVLLQSVLALLASEANLKNIRFQTSFGKCPNIAGEENQLKQVFINVIKNSIEAISGHGEIRISTRLLPNHQVLVRLADNGCGVSEEYIAKLGEPFFTTKEKGTGLGLMISSKIIKDHNGSLQITSKKNKGTVVKITLPIAEDQIGSS
ncbi:MAG: sensor histidine kinase, partial [Brevibacillus sp.]|nr:sensor histidine kinase [Brevibacillus sp.]